MTDGWHESPWSDMTTRAHAMLKSEIVFVLAKKSLNEN